MGIYERLLTEPTPKPLQGKQVASKSANQKTSNEEKKHGLKQTNHRVNKPIRKFASYLREDSLKRIKMLAIEREKHDYDILQEAVDQYLQRGANVTPT